MGGQVGQVGDGVWRGLTAKVKVAVLYGMVPKDLQDKVSDECAVNWYETTEAEAGLLYTKIKAQLRNIAKARREMAGLKRESAGGWYGEHSNQVEIEEEHYDEKGGDEAYVRRAAMFSKDIASGTRSGIATRARAACGRLALGVGLRSILSELPEERERMRWVEKITEGNVDPREFLEAVGCDNDNPTPVLEDMGKPRRRIVCLGWRQHRVASGVGQRGSPGRDDVYED